MRPFAVGRFQVATVRDGLFRLDGGAMFGIVPRPVWERVSPPDERHRIHLSLNPLLIRTPQKNLLVDTGIGGKQDAKWCDLFGVDHRWSVVESLKEQGLAVSDIDFVIPSHLHFDHMGGATVREGGRVVPTFSRATYLVQEKEWEAANSDNPRSKGSYLREDFLPVEASGRLKLLAGDEEVVPGVRVRRTGGHTAGHQIVFLESDGQKAVYLGDILPTTAHAKPSWCMGYDCYPLEVARLKVEILEQAAREGWDLILDHDVNVAIARSVKDGNQIRLVSVRPLEPA